MIAAALPVYGAGDILLCFMGTKVGHMCSQVTVTL